MDSITQATLGAAVGQAVLGEKMGNKAILIGAIAGTIPDLDIFSRLFLDHEIYGLVYHRGISHSIAFTIFASPIFAWLSMKYYERGWNKKLEVQSVLALWWGLFYVLIIWGFISALNLLSGYNTVTITILGALILGLYPLGKSLYKSITEREKIEYNVSFTQWTSMYFFAFLTHWLIDACTAYGTQIFEPFSRYRVAFNNISIVDPLYTVPMILGLVFVVFAKTYKTKRFWNYLGLGIATTYMASTFYTKSIMDTVVTDNLKEQGIEYTEFITYPTIFNTILWQTTVITEDAYYYGKYSMLDSKPYVEFTKLPKNHALIEKHKEHEYMKILLWFANGYYNLSEDNNGNLVFNNLRFGLMETSKEAALALDDRYVFRFTLTEENGKFDVQEKRDVDELIPKIKVLFQALWIRMKGQ